MYLGQLTYDALFSPYENLAFFSIFTKTESVLQIFHLFLQIFSPPFPTLLCALGDHVDLHGPAWTAPMGSVGLWHAFRSGPWRILVGDVSGRTARSECSPGSSLEKSQLLSISFSSSASSKHLFPSPSSQEEVVMVTHYRAGCVRD